MRKNTKSFVFNDVECLDAKEVEADGFVEGDVSFGKTLATFNFDQQTSPQSSQTVSVDSSNKTNQFQVRNTLLKGLTPPIDGEQFTVKRSYQLRPSTLRKLNEIKAHHSDVNVYLNTILDEAILHYYDQIFPRKITS